jgi:hypothetical protein
MLPHLIRFLALRGSIRLGLLLRQLTGVNNDKAQGLLRHASVTPLHLDQPHDALASPLAWPLILRASRFLDQQGQRWLLLPPRLQGLAYGTGAGDKCD